MATYTVNGQTINVQEKGPANGQIALLIHGWSSSWYAVSPLLPLLSHKYRCLAVDLPGYGESPQLPGRVTVPDYVDLMIDLIRQVTRQPIVLVGHSMGGMISASLVLKEPDLVERMILVAPTISGHLSRQVDLTLAPFALLEHFALTNALVSVLEPIVNITDHLLRPALFADRTTLKQEDYERIRADVRRRGQGRVRAECFWAMRSHDLRGKLGPIKTPTLVIWGMEDNTVPLRDASVIAREWPDADLRIIPNAGHWPQFETPDMTARYVRAFLSTPLKLLHFEL
jgi:pimeloyl-ACP methyl ester carboxylesterase